MSSRRQRRTRRPSIANTYLNQWREQVEFLERRARTGNYVRVNIRSLLLDGTPQPQYCDHPGCVISSLGSEPRARLEGYIRRGGRNARRLQLAVTRLDNRFRDVTVPTDAPRTLHWWHRREPWA